MGLASSQARLLSLTSRQQTVEARAQRLLSDKMRLSNDSDAAYQKYMNVLEDTTLKTRQTDDLGQTFWIDGNINNLMRYNANERTGGSVFYVQDLETGKLYVPQEVFNNYNNLTAATVPAGHEYADAMKFATLFGVQYIKVDENEDIKINYERAVEKGWNNALTDAQFEQYTIEANKDSEIQATAKILAGMLPRTNQIDGQNIYKIAADKIAVATNYETFVMKVLNSPIQSAAYEAKDIRLLQESLDLVKSISSNATKDIGYKDNQIVRDEDGNTVTNEDGTPKMDEFFATKTYKTTSLSVNNGAEYMNIQDGTNEFSTDQKFELMLNGGTISWKAKESLTFDNSWINHFAGYSDEHKLSQSDPARHAAKDVEVTTNIYDTDTYNILAEHGATNLGDALTKLFNKMSNCRKNSDILLNNLGKTDADVVNYRKFKQIEKEYSMYKPDYKYVPTNNVKATYYETLFNSIVAAGGCTGVNEETAKNAQWVENMIKNAKVILTTWDNNEMTLSRTSPSLHVDVKEISDDRRVAQAESDYEAETAFINEKDTKIDNILNKLETERTTITTEIDGIKKVMEDNVSNNFKVFS